MRIALASWVVVILGAASPALLGMADPCFHAPEYEDGTEELTVSEWNGALPGPTPPADKANAELLEGAYLDKYAYVFTELDGSCRAFAGMRDGTGESPLALPYIINRVGAVVVLDSFRPCCHVPTWQAKHRAIGDFTLTPPLLPGDGTAYARIRMMITWYWQWRDCAGEYQETSPYQRTLLTIRQSLTRNGAGGLDAGGDDEIPTASPVEGEEDEYWLPVVDEERGGFEDWMRHQVEVELIWAEVLAAPGGVAEAEMEVGISNFPDRYLRARCASCGATAQYSY